MKKLFFILIIFCITVSAFAITLEEQLGPIPKDTVTHPLNLAENFFIIGSGAQQGSYGTESAVLFKKYGPHVVWNAHVENFSDTRFVKIMKDVKVPLLTQGWGMSFANYLKERDALDYTWGDLNPNKKTPSAMAHELSMPHPATREIWENYVRSSILNGAAGYVFCDQVTPWDFGRGSGGCNPVAISQFRQDLAGRDEGVLVNLDGTEKIIHFKDYVEYYLGFMPEPKSLGIDSWYDYYPTRKALYDPEGYKEYVIDSANTPDFYFNVDAKTKSDFVPEFLIRDMLIHYEALKFTDNLGKTAAKYGGVYFPMPNTEDMANGNDMLFMSSLVNVQGLLDEYFQSPAYNDSVYTKIDYLTKNIKNITGKRYGTVLESGGGGNASPYYDHYVSYMIAYESKALHNANMLEGDFWPNLHAHLDVNTPVNDYAASAPEIKARMACILSYANGFKYGLKDNGKKIAPDFTTVVSRRIFRPWGKEYTNYLWNFGDSNKNIQPEEVLYNSGYIFNTVGFENAENLEGEMVLWTCNTPPIEKFDAFMNRMKEGFINTAITVAEGLDTVLDKNLKVVSLASYYPSLTTEIVMDAAEGNLPVKCRNKDYAIYGNIYKIPSAKPIMLSDDGVVLLYRLKVGKADLYIVPFNPGLKENAPITKYVYDIVLNRSSIFTHFESIDESGIAVYKDSKGYVAKLRNKTLNFDNWGKFYEKEGEINQRCDYEISSSTEGKIRVDKPNTQYFVYNYFDGEGVPVMSDENGFVSIRSENKTMSIFFIREKEDSKLMEDLIKRREEFAKALTLDM